MNAAGLVVTAMSGTPSTLAGYAPPASGSSVVSQGLSQLVGNFVDGERLAEVVALNFVALVQQCPRPLTANNALDRVEGYYAGPNTKLGISVVALWHITYHYGQLVEYLRLNGIVPPMTQKYGVKGR
jgi:hypothetical protein